MTVPPVVLFSLCTGLLQVPLFRWQEPFVFALVASENGRGVDRTTPSASHPLAWVDHQRRRDVEIALAVFAGLVLFAVFGKPAAGLVRGLSPALAVLIGVFLRVCGWISAVCCVGGALFLAKIYQESETRDPGVLIVGLVCLVGAGASPPLFNFLAGAWKTGVAVAGPLAEALADREEEEKPARKTENADAPLDALLRGALLAGIYSLLRQKSDANTDQAADRIDEITNKYLKRSLPREQRKDLAKLILSTFQLWAVDYAAKLSRGEITEDQMADEFLEAAHASEAVPEGGEDLVRAVGGLVAQRLIHLATQEEKGSDWFAERRKSMRANIRKSTFNFATFRYTPPAAG